MGRVKYPFRVKYNGEYYAPGEPIAVDDVAAAVELGAKVIQQIESVAEPMEVLVESVKKPGRPRKTEE